MRTAAFTGTVPVQLERTVHTTSMLVNLFEEGNWFGGFSRVDNWYHSLTAIENLLEFLVVNCELFDLFVFSFCEANLDTL